MVYDEGAHYEIAVRGSEILARARVAPFETVLGSAHRPPGPVVLVVETVPQQGGPDVVHLGFESPTGASRFSVPSTAASSQPRYKAASSDA